jgi:uncharacterized protein (DUF2267 family)
LLAHVSGARAQELAPQRGSLDLSPAAAARAPRFGAKQEETEASGDPHEGDENDLSERVPGLIRASRASSSEKTARVIEEAVWRILRPWQKAMSPQRVRYWYIGRTIDAVIHHDGSVELRTKAGLTLAPVSFQKIQQSQPGSSEPGSQAFGSPTGAGVGISVTDPGRVFTQVATKKSQDNAEARRFLEDTLPLRERLMVAGAHKLDRGAVQRLGMELGKLWAHSGALADKQERTFALWDQCTEDAAGQEGRTRIESFLRELQETQGRCPYDAAQLVKLNAARTSKQAFAPCLQVADPANDASH